MVTFRRTRQVPSRSALIGILLVLTLALAGVMAYQAVDATRSHRAIAEETLHEHALFAAWELNSTLRREMYDGLLGRGLEVVAKSGGIFPEMPLFPLLSLQKAAREFDWLVGLENLDFVFRYDLRTGEFLSSGEVAPAEATREWIIRMVEERAVPLTPEVKKPSWEMTFHGLGEEQRLVVLAISPSPGEEAEIGFGFQLRMAALETVLAKIGEKVSLLPPSLTKGKDLREYLSFRVHDRLHRELYASSPQYVSPYEAVDTVGTMFGGLHGVVTMRPEAADLLVIGGLPRSRLPTILGLLAVASALVMAAIFQIRREQELAVLRTDFVSSVSHQLRTPLAQIRMFGETLLLGRVRNEDEERRSLEIIVKEAQRLTHQVDNVLLFSRAQHKDMELRPQETPLGPLVGEVLESFCPLAESQGCRVEARIEGAPSALVDPVSARQILLNLLENAVKYGPQDQKVEVRLRRGLPGTVRLTVEDQGEGIPEDRREEIFLPYSRLQRHRESAVAGSGIGLAVVRELVQRQGGSVWVEDATGGGARFVVELPEVAAKTPPTVQAS